MCIICMNVSIRFVWYEISNADWLSDVGCCKMIQAWRDDVPRVWWIGWPVNEGWRNLFLLFSSPMSSWSCCCGQLSISPRAYTMDAWIALDSFDFPSSTTFSKLSNVVSTSLASCDDDSNQPSSTTPNEEDVCYEMPMHLKNLCVSQVSTSSEQVSSPQRPSQSDFSVAFDGLSDGWKAASEITTAGDFDLDSILFLKPKDVVDSCEWVGWWFFFSFLNFWVYYKLLFFFSESSCWRNQAYVGADSSRLPNNQHPQTWAKTGGM